MRTGIETCFWVYLFYRPSADAYVCCLSVLPPEEVRSGQTEDELVYRSGFGEMDEALGHKLFLELWGAVWLNVTASKQCNKEMICIFLNT